LVAQVDHGLGAGDSGLQVYVAGAADVRPRQIQAAAASWRKMTGNVSSEQ